MGRSLTDFRPIHKASRILRSAELVVEVMEPGHSERYNRGIRFTPVAAVLRVSMNRDEFLCNPVEHDAFTEHAGLAAEFDLVTPGGPPGFAEAKAGEGFVKVGVGVLQKDSEDYGFWRHYALLEPAATSARWGTTTADFHQVCPGARGYAWELWAGIEVAGQTVAVEWKLANTGAKPFQTHHYAHNFFRFNDQPVGPDYVLRFPYDFRANGLQNEQKRIGREIHFVAEIPTAVNMEVPYPKEYEGPNDVVVTHTGCGQTVRCSTSIPGIRTAVHASRRYLCPEQFVRLKLEPGEETRWTRTYTFARRPD